MPTPFKSHYFPNEAWLRENLYTVYSESFAQDLSESEKKSKIGFSYDEIQAFKKDCQHFWAHPLQK
jgi:hypothetical protein